MRDTSKYYRRLVEAYQRWYPNPQEVVNALIEKLSMERGISKEEAIVELYKLVYGGHVEIRRRSPGLAEALRLALNRLRVNPILVVFPLLGESARILSILPLLAFALWLFWTLDASMALLPSNLSGRDLVGVLFQTQVLETLVPILAVASLCFLIILSLGESIESSLILKGSERALSGGTVSLEDIWAPALKVLPMVFITALLENTIAFLVPLVVAFLCLVVPLSSGGGIAGFLLLALMVLLLLYAVMAKLALVFSLPSVVIGGRHPLSALMESLRLFGENIAEVLGLAVIGFATEILTAFLAGASGGFGMLFGGLAMLFSLILVRPLILVALAVLYMSATGRGVDTKRYTGPNIAYLAYRILRESLGELRGILHEPVWLLASLLLFLSGAYPGFLVGGSALGRAVWKLVVGDAHEMLSKPPAFTLFPGIFFHNWTAAILASASGIYTPLAPALVALVNGFVLGFVIGAVDTKVAIVGIAPHGIVELPCFVIAVAAGIRLFFRLLGSGRPARELKRALLVAAALMPFLLVAALIEAFITPALLGSMSP